MVGRKNSWMWKIPDCETDPSRERGWGWEDDYYLLLTNGCHSSTDKGSTNLGTWGKRGLDPVRINCMRHNVYFKLEPRSNYDPYSPQILIRLTLFEINPYSSVLPCPGDHIWLHHLPQPYLGTYLLFSQPLLFSSSLQNSTNQPAIPFLCPKTKGISGYRHPIVNAELIFKNM